MKLNKLEKLNLRYSLPKVKRFKPIPKPTLEEWETGDIVSGIQICLLISHLLYDVKFLIDDRPDLTAGEHQLLFISYMTAVKKLFQKDKDQSYILKKEFDEIKNNFNIKFDD